MAGLRNLRFENGAFILDGYPLGSTIHGLTSEMGDGLARLFLFRNDLAHVAQWAAEIESDSVSWELRQALSIAATIKFCGCFESTQGHRKQPLKPKSIFSPEDRLRLKGVFLMRNKIVAHDDQMFPANSSAIVLDKDGTAIEAVCLGMNFNISDLPAFRDLCSLARIALQWIFEAFEDAARTVVETVNMRPLDERLGVQVGPQLTITIRDKITE